MSLLIKELNISEFRGIRRLVKPIELGSFNVIIGRNNVGKTTILEALYLLREPFMDRFDPLYGRNSFSFIAGIHGGGSSLVFGYAGTARINFKLDKEIRVELGSVHGRVSVKNIVFELSPQRVERILLENFVVDQSDYLSFLKSLGVVSGKSTISFYIPNDTSAYREIKRYVLNDNVWSWIEKRGFHSKVVRDILAPVIYDHLTEVTIKRDKLCVRKEVEEGIGPLYIDVDSLGEGIRRTILVYLAIEYLNPKIVLWDDIEVASHPSLLRSLLKWLANSNRQVVLTTHSIDVLYEIVQVQPEDCRVIVLRKSANDIVDYKVLGLEEIEDALEKDIDPRKIIDELEL